MTVRVVHVTSGELLCSGAVTTEPATREDPGGTWVEDVYVTDERTGARLEFESLDAATQEAIEGALVEASGEDDDADSAR